MPTAANTHKDYSRTPLVRKLGLVTTKGGIGEVALLGEPQGFRELLLDLPNTTTLHTHLRPTTKLALAFIRSRTELTALLEMLPTQLPRETHIWLIHPKAHTKPDINQNDVRNAALDIGLVDYKVCSVTPDWSALKFAWRGQSKSPGHKMKS
jgi:Protein of unknown function (DUF3052)